MPIVSAQVRSLQHASAPRSDRSFIDVWTWHARTSTVSRVSGGGGRRLFERASLSSCDPSRRTRSRVIGRLQRADVTADRSLCTPTAGDVRNVHPLYGQRDTPKHTDIAHPLPGSARVESRLPELSPAESLSACALFPSPMRDHVKMTSSTNRKYILYCCQRRTELPPLET